MTRCRVSEEDARDPHFDGLSDAEERELALQAHIDRRETLKAIVAASQEKIDRLLKYANFSPDAEDIEAAEVLDGCMDFYIYKFILKDREVKNDYR